MTSSSTTTVSGRGRVMLHTTNTQKRVPRLYFTADEPFEVRGEFVQPDYFDSLCYSGMLLDWQGVTTPVTARSYATIQRMEVTITRKPNGYFELVSVTLLGPCEFEPGARVSFSELRDFPDQARIPLEVTAQMAVCATTPRRAFLILPFGPWITKTGRPEDLVNTRPATAPAATSAAP